MRRLPEMTLFLNPLPNSYERLSAPEAFCRLCWSMERDRSALRIPLPQERFARMQLSSPDPTMNVYIGFALLIEAALEGLRQNLSLDGFFTGADSGAPLLPLAMEEAIALARDSAFVNAALPPAVTRRYVERAQGLLAARSRDAAAQTHAQILRF